MAVAQAHQKMVDDAIRISEEERLADEARIKKKSKKHKS